MNASVRPVDLRWRTVDRPINSRSCSPTNALLSPGAGCARRGRGYKPEPGVYGACGINSNIISAPAVSLTVVTDGRTEMTPLDAAALIMCAARTHGK